MSNLGAACARSHVTIEAASTIQEPPRRTIASTTGAITRSRTYSGRISMNLGWADSIAIETSVDGQPPSTATGGTKGGCPVASWATKTDSVRAQWTA
jgi:hypothetical protein